MAEAGTAYIRADSMKSSEKKFVPVEQEPLHKEILRNSRIRLYRAVLTPGTRTAYHRHSQDTVYIVCTGGSIKTELFPGSGRCSTILPGWITLREKIRLIAGKLVTGALHLHAGFMFYMPSGANPVIHAAAASRTNADPMNLIGIELYGGKESVHCKNERKEWGRRNFFIHGVRIKHVVLPSGKTVTESGNGNPLCIVSCGQSAVVLEAGKETKLSAGGFLWLDSLSSFVIQNTGSKTLQLIVLEF